MKSLVWFAMLTLMLTSASAAVIRGAIYDLALEQVSAVVEINTIPQQRMIAVNGTYQFSVQPGQYIIRAQASGQEGFAEENVEIRDEGVYHLDLFLYPDLGEVDLRIVPEQDVPWILVLSAVIVGGALLYYRRMRPSAAAEH